MKETITYRFNNFKRTEIGAIPTLSRSVRGMKYGKQIVIDAFNKFVPKDEYVQSGTVAIKRCDLRFFAL